MEEWFPVVDESGAVVDKATRRECHNGSFKLHPVVHLHILSPDGRILLQKRSMSKDIQPGRWDTAVGGHVDYGETVLEALHREVREELGIINFAPRQLVVYPFRSDKEYELVNAYYWIAPAGFIPEFDPMEIDDVKYWAVDEINQAAGSGVLTPNFEQEFNRVREILLTI